MVTLAGNVVIVIVAIACVGYAVRGNWHRLRWEKPLRDEMQASPGRAGQRGRAADRSASGAVTGYRLTDDVARHWPNPVAKTRPGSPARPG
jgi:hypothetical protein